MKQVKRVSALLLALVLLFTGVDWAGCTGVTAFADNTPTLGSTSVGEAPEALSTLGEWVYWVEDGQATVAGYADKEAASLQLPARLGGYPVTGIGRRAFSENAALVSVQIPTNVTRIAEDAFEGLTGLTVSAYHGAYALAYAEKKHLGVNEIGHAGIVFADGVIDLSGMPAGSYTNLTDAGVTFNANEATFLTVGQVVFFPESEANPTGLARRVERIVVSGDQQLVGFSVPEWGECFERFSGEEDLTFDWNHVVLEEGVTLEDVGDAGSFKANREKSINYEFSVESADKKGKITISGNIKSKFEASASWDIGTKGISPDVKEIKISLKNTDSVSGKVTAVAGKTKFCEKKLFSLPISSSPVSGSLDFYLLFQISGEVEYKVAVVTSHTLSYKNGKLDLKNEKSLKDKSLILKAEVKFGPELKLNFEVGLAKVLSVTFFEATLGFYVKASGTATYTQLRSGTESIHLCTDLIVTWEVKLEFKIGLVKIQAIGKSKSTGAYIGDAFTLGPFTIWNGHFDNGEFVGSSSNCTLKNRNITYLVENKTYSTTTSTVNMLLKEPKTPTKDGHTFDGWFVDAKASGLPGSDYKFDFSKNVMPFCGKNGTLTLVAKLTPIPVKSITLNKTSATIYTNDKKGVQLVQTVSPANAANSSVSWKSSNTKVAAVNSNGKVMPVSAGTATITCTSKSNPSVKATFKITVKQYVEKVSLSASADEIFEGETLTVKAAVSPSDASNKGLTWSSSNTKVATVDQNGKVTGVSCGTAVITATAKDGSKVAGKFTVDILLPVTGIALDSTSAILYTNNTAGLQLNPTLTPAEASLSSVGWETSDAKVAAVSRTGLVTPVAPGTVTITCRSKSDKSVIATCTVTVKQYVESVAVSGTLASIVVGETLQLASSVGPANATDKSLNWTSSDAGVAAVDQSGKITGVSGGSAVITATAADGSGVKDSYKVVVVALPASTPAVPVTGVTTDSASLTVYTVDKTAQVTAAVSPANADQSMVWASSNESAATIDNTGRIIMVKGGTTILTGRSASDPYQYVNINLRVVQSVERITITGETKVDDMKGSTVLTAVVAPANAEDKSVSWSSSDTSVATVDQNGKVTGTGKGGVTQITATAKDGSKVKNSNTFYVKFGPDPIPVETVTLDLMSLSRYTNERDGVQLTPTVLPEYADDLSVIWSSSDEQVATVDKNGVVTFTAPGKTTITCRSVNNPDVTATCQVTVKQYVDQIILDGDTYTLLPGETARLAATVYPSNASDKSLSWSSSDASVATVDQNGKVTAVGYGVVEIIATANDGSGAEAVYSIEVEKELQLTVSMVNDTMYTQGTETGEVAYISLTNGSMQRMAEAGGELSWSMTRKSGSGDTELSVFNTTLDRNGTTYASSVALLSGSSYPSAGTEIYTVTCRVGELEESVDITVTVDAGAYADSVSLTDAKVGANTITTKLGEAAVIPAAPYAADGKTVPENLRVELRGDGYYRAHAEESAVDSGLQVSFDESGVYTATVRYTKGNLAYDVAATFNVADENGIVHLRVEGLELSEDFLRMVEGESAQLTAAVLPEDAYDRSVTWESSDESVATVTAQGAVKAIAPGTALITCTANDGSGQAAACLVSVEAYLQLDESELAYTVYTGGRDHVDLEIINVTVDSQRRLVEDGLNVTWTVERVSGTSTELGLSEFVSEREDGLAVSGELLKLLRVNGAGTDEYRLVCSAGGYTDSCVVRVTVGEAALPTAVTLNTDSYEATVNEWFTADLSYTVSPSGAALPEDIQIGIEGGNAFRDAVMGLYSYAEPENLIFEKAGTFTAYVTFSGTNYSYRCPITIAVADEDGVVPPTITDVIVSEEELLLTTGDTRTLTVSVEPAGVSYGKVTWTSSDTSVATVNSSGKVTAIGPGYASIIASIPESDYEGGCLVYVEEGINFREDALERTVFVDGATRMKLDTLMLTDNTSARLSGAPTWTLKRVSGISLTLRAEPYETKSAQGTTLYGCELILYSVSKEGDTVYELTCSDGTDSKTVTVTVHAVNRERLLPASITLDQTVFTADIGELIVLQPVVTAYPVGSRLPDGIVVSLESDTQAQQALNAEDTFVSQSRSTFSFSKAGTYPVNLVYAYSNMKYVVPVTFRIRDESGEVPVQASRMALSERSLYLTAGDTAALEAVFTPVDATNQSVTWTSSNPKVATVDGNGTVKAVANGTATITCVPDDEECARATCAVTVEDYLTVTNGATSRTLYLQGEQENTVGYAQLSEGTRRRLAADGVIPVWTIDTAQATHASVDGAVEPDASGVTVATRRLLSGGTDSYTIRCQAGEHTWSQTYTLKLVDLGAAAPQTVSIRATEVAVAVNEAVTIDFSPVLTPADASLPSGMADTGYVGVGDFYRWLDRGVYEENGDQVTLAFTKPGQYLLTRRYLLSNLQYVTACTITVGGEESGRGVLKATETEFTVYSGGKSGSVSTVSITDAILYQLWRKELRWSAERLSGDSMTVALKENGSSVDVFVANVAKNGTDVWRVRCDFAGMTEYVDITLTADDPRGALPESIALANDRLTGMIGNVITVPLGVICSPSGTMLPDQGDAFWSFRFDGAGEERSTHTIENGLLAVDFTMSGYYTGTLRYQSGNVSYELPVYFVIQDEEQEVSRPDLALYAVNTFDTVYPEGETGVAIGQMVMAEGLSAYSTGGAVAYMKDAGAVWKVTKTGSAAKLSLKKVSDNVYDLVLDQIKGSGDVTYTVTCTVDGKAYTVKKTLHVADETEARPDATLRRTAYQAAVGEEVTIDSRLYARADGSILQASAELDATGLLAAVGYEIDESGDTWSMTFYEEGTYHAGVSAQVSNLKVEVGIVIVVGEKGEETVLTVLKLPAGLTTIGEEAFAEIAADVVDLRGTRIDTIGAGAFKNSVNVSMVYLPDSVASIADDAFYGCLNAVFCCEAGSYAASWAAEHNIPVTNP